MSTSLGKSFPEEYRIKFCQEHLIPGAVLRIKSTYTKPQKIKRCVIIALKEETISLALCYVNTNKPSSPYLQKGQFALSSKGRSYLDHDSFLDCAQLYEENLEVIRHMMINDIGIHLGQMSKEDFRKAKNLVVSAKSIPIKLKKKYGLI